MMSLLDDYAPEVAEEVGRRREVEAELRKAYALLDEWMAEGRALCREELTAIIEKTRTFLAPKCMGVSCGGTMGHYPPCPLAPEGTWHG